jgi:hypothetical protein
MNTAVIPSVIALAVVAALSYLHTSPVAEAPVPEPAVVIPAPPTLPTKPTMPPEPFAYAGAVLPAYVPTPKPHPRHRHAKVWTK